MAFSLYAQCDVGRSASIPPEDPGNPEPTVKFYPGIYTKIMDFMLGGSLLPFTQFQDSDTTSVWGQLNRNAWMRGIMWTVGWGEIETQEGVYDFSHLRDVLDIVGNPDSPKNIYNVSGRASAQNKKALFLLDVKSFNADDATVDAMIPQYLQAQGTAYSNGMKRYHRLIAFQQEQQQTGAVTQGYHIDWQDFRNGLTGNDAANQPIYTLRNRYQAFLQALYDEFKDHPALAGFVLTEPIPVGSNIVLSSEYNRNFFFDGRLQWLKNCKSIFTQHPIIEMPTFDNTYMQEMTNNNAADGCVVNRLGIGGPNFHNGTNLQSIINARNYAAGKVIVCNQCQGLDMDTKTGYYTRPNTVSNPAPNDVFYTSQSPGHRAWLDILRRIAVKIIDAVVILFILTPDLLKSRIGTIIDCFSASLGEFMPKIIQFDLALLAHFLLQFAQHFQLQI